MSSQAVSVAEEVLVVTRLGDEIAMLENLVPKFTARSWKGYSLIIHYYDQYQ